MTEELLRLYGTAESEVESSTLSAGDLSVVFQGGNLQLLRFRGYEVLRAIAFLVRDRDWGTCVAAINGLAVEHTEDGFSIAYSVRFSTPSGANLDCSIAISGTETSLSFSADCVSDADFETARTGFAVLHPIAEVAGKPVTVKHADGRLDGASWPEQIEPWQPFKDISAITHVVAPGIKAETAFYGGVFEMEDQRNWTDASYKTYVRPLALPWPYRIAKDEPFSQRVELTIRAEKEAHPAGETGEDITFRMLPSGRIFPDIGVGLRPECLDEELAAVDMLTAIGARHLIGLFDPDAGHGAEALRGYADVVERCGLKLTLEFAVPCKRPLDVEMAETAALVREAGLSLDSLFVCPSVDRQSTPPGSKWPDCPALEDVYAAARSAFPGVRLGGGMMSYFTELNRKRVPAAHIDYVSHCTNPIVHAADDLSVMQTFEALRHVVCSVRAIYGGKPYRIGPSTIAMRQNPYGSATKDNPSGLRLPMANFDPRHNGQFGAAWTLAYAATVAPAGLEVLTLSTLAGSFGLVAGEGEPTPPGGQRPLAHVLARLGALSGKEALVLETSRPDLVLGLASREQILLANITPRPQTVRLPTDPRRVTLIVDGQNQQTTDGRITLPPYGCAEVAV